MTKGYNLLKGTVSHLQVMDEPKELRSDDIGLLAIIGLMIVGVVGELLGALIDGNISLEGKSYQCYVGRKKVKGKLSHVDFKNGDDVEMIVKPIDNDQYQFYAVRIPKYHALYFPHALGITTLPLLKSWSIIIGFFSLFILLVLLIITIGNDTFRQQYQDYIVGCFIMFICLTILFFFLTGGRYTFISNRIFATLGYPRPWLHDILTEDKHFKRLNILGDPKLFDDPQTPEFEQIKELDPNANYYCRTPTLPDWVTVIDERGFMPQITEPQETPNQEQSND
ncbi:hypothetical protein [uncultured Gilliamella sp.]|uniref:hypothetical protein n=1 Tax=uncultured Gilliamella sp. TaxID=1193505 RepID=UPI0025D68970|nr:hypothetical protein [uncultured Gilliamella sp.]